MKVLNRLFSMLAAVVVSAMLPFTVVTESEANAFQDVHGTSGVTTSIAGKESDGGEAR
ncbi:MULTISPECIES: hypothetical protein [Modicisalibacter]|uniref:Uncharacterized protein n=1 Tax=Modicisalibacter tunisiensis TaxID=390637 RepID=A0ABS7WY05_9GAMM|nr:MULTISPECIES: hypothetical protein [Modicisalibacter]KXS37520.1 MAG: hypothetical protein AWU55_2265 [Halomonadaceae bacterium T82-2]MBZ9539551.1 hypothetical protein [Modicisalibacter tunisiensis]MBZ9567044.1 hypothetical protein [Modicisalibacter tunisiensis]